MKISKKIGVGLILMLALFLLSCSSLQRAGLTSVGAGVGALVSPPAAMLGAAGGVLLADVYLQEGELEEQQETIAALTRGDLNSLSNNILGEVYGWLKLAGFLFVLHFGYTMYRQKVATGNYKKINGGLK